MMYATLSRGLFFVWSVVGILFLAHITIPHIKIYFG
jgi:hypothetical protein